MNNEIKLDSKATNYLKDKLGGGGSGGSQIQYIDIYGSINDYTMDVTIQVDDNTLETYEDLYNYLYNKGIRTNDATFISTFGTNSNGDEIFIAIASQSVSTPFANEHNLIVVNTSGNPIKIIDDENFSITYLGN